MTSPLLGSLASTVAGALSSTLYDCTLTRMVVPSSPTYDPADPPPAVPVTYTFKGMEEEYSAGTRGQGLVGATDVRVLILAGTLAVEPQPMDLLTVRGNVLRIVPEDARGVRPVSSDPARATWSCRCQK